MPSVLKPWGVEPVRHWISWEAGRLLQEASQFRGRSRATLQVILNHTGGSIWGQAHGLAGADKLRAFEALAASSYVDYEPFIQRMAQGESNVLTMLPVIYFAETSGTTGIPKLIPLTRVQMVNLVRWGAVISYGMAVRAGLLGPLYGPVFMVLTQFKGDYTAGGIPRGPVTAGGFTHLGWMGNFITASQAVVEVQPQATSRYLHLLWALRSDDLWAIGAFFPAMLLFVFRDLQAQAPLLLKDLTDGTLKADLELTVEQRSRLQALWRAVPARARELERLLSRPWTVRDLWPGVGCVITATGGPFRFYIDQLRPYLGEVPVFSPLYAASEAAGLGVARSPQEPGYVLTPRESYLELLPLGGDGEPVGRPVSAWQAEVGGTYEVMVTTLSGLMRYRLGDVVRVSGFYGEAPVVDFVERRGNGLNLIGEKTAEHVLVTACETVFRQAGIPIVDYFMTLDLKTTPGRYLLTVEFSAGVRISSAEFDQLVEAVDRELCHLSPVYAASRDIAEIGPLGGQRLRPGAIERYRDLRVARGTPVSQFKVPHVVSKGDFVEEYFSQEVVGS